MEKLRFYHSFINNYYFKIFYQGYGRLDQQWNHLNTCDCFNRLYIVTDGEGEIHHNEKKTLLKKGYAYILPQYETFDLKCYSSMTKIWIGFNVGLLKGHDFFANINDDICIKIEKDRLEKLVQTITSEKASDILWCQGQIFQIVSEALDSHEVVDKQKMKLFIKYKELFHYINEHCYFDYDTKKMAIDLSLAEYKLKKEFTKDMGYTLKEYIHNQIVSNICSDLITTDMTIGELAERYHFKDPFYLSRFFKKYMGIAPTYYKQRYQL